MNKKLLSLLILLSFNCSATLAFAQSEGFDILPKDYRVEYLSWCDQNKVVTMNSAGQYEVIADCLSQDQTCKTIERQTTHGTYYYGACMDKK